MNPYPFVPLTETQHNALTGSMLGDGCLALGKSNINATLMITRSIKDAKYLQYEADVFSNFASKRYKNGINTSNNFSKFHNMKIEKCDFATSACPILKWIEKEFGINLKVVFIMICLSDKEAC